MYWLVNTERYTHTVELSQLANVMVYHSLCLCLCLLVLLFTFAFALHVCVVAVAVCSVCLYPFYPYKTRWDFLMCRVATVPTWKTQKNDCFNVRNRCTHTLTHFHARIHKHIRFKRWIVNSCWDSFSTFPFNFFFSLFMKNLPVSFQVAIWKNEKNFFWFRF